MSSHSTTSSAASSDVLMNHDRQARCFNAYMAVYKGQAYKSKEHEGWVRDSMQRFPELCRTTLIYHYEDGDSWGHYDAVRDVRVYGNDDKFRENLMYPVPVYWGRSREDLFDWGAVRKGLGYSEAQSMKLSDELRDTVRYAIVGAVKVKAWRHLPERDAYVIHTEGVNLESQETAAFKAIVGVVRRKEDILSMYYKRHRDVLKLIIEAAMSQVDVEDVFIQAPMIGAGCFLRGLEQGDLLAADFLWQQVFAMESVMRSAPREWNFMYKLCIFNTSEFADDIVAAYQRMAETYTRFTVGTNNDGGNVLADVPYGNPKQKVFVVNPGDLRSFIGNGMSHENSVEGFVVADAKGSEPQWQNTSFLHNAYFNPDIFVRSGWKATSDW